ncbi:MAG: hypothetical protein HRU15_04975 [Planctomycetes bacterium]|nr:hypothetical protein [Planctomycetota bacterium]
MTYRELDIVAIGNTITRLSKRISERFPSSHLYEVACELRMIALESAERTQSIRKPIIVLRMAIWGLLFALFCVLLVVPIYFKQWGDVASVLEFVTSLESYLGVAFFITALVIFLLSIEVKVKRARALDAIHELRALAHVVDMHQLTKDPVMIIGGGGEKTESSPERGMNAFELSRYFDYCSEMLSLISKVAAIYAQSSTDPVAMQAVDEVEGLTTGLSRKIWQKIMILDRH